MTQTTNYRSSRGALLWCCLFFVLAVVAAACGDDANTSAADGATGEPATETATDDENDDHDDVGREEHPEPRARLAIVERDAPIVHFLDLHSGEIVGTVELSLDKVVTEGLTTTEDGRYLLIGGTTNVDIIDGGAWSSRHGDHAHHYTQPPQLIGTVEGPNPSHLISHGGVTAFYFDGSGEALVVDESSLSKGEVDVVEAIDTGAAHHGFAVPVDGGYVVTWPFGEEVMMPDNVVVLDETATIVAEHDCVETHGEATFPRGAAAACRDGILLLTADGDHWDGQVIDYPPVDDADPYGFGPPRAWMIDTVAGIDWGVSVMGSRHLLVTNVEDGTAIAHGLDETIAIRGVGIHADSGAVVALTHDGTVQLVDPLDGTITAERTVIDPFPEPVLEGTSPPARTLTVAGDLAWVVDPEANLIVELDLANGLDERRRFELAFTPDAVRVHGIR